MLDPVSAPDTGTPAGAGGSTTREPQQLLSGLRSLDLPNGADMVEVVPPFDETANITPISSAKICIKFSALPS